MDIGLPPTETAAWKQREHLTRAMGGLVGGLLADDKVTDIMLNAPLPGERDGRVWVVRQGQVAEVAGTLTYSQAESFIAAVASTLDTVATRDTAIIEGKLLIDGSRFEGIIPPVAAFPMFSIRLKARQIYSLDDYVRQGAMTERQRDAIVEANRLRLNIIITGGTGSGKTTLLNGVIQSMCDVSPHHRFGVMEDTGELQCSAPNQVMLLADANHPMRLLLRASLRMFPDRIIVGEVRGGEALDMLMAWNTGHDGGACSIHSNVVSPGAALERLANLVSMASDAPRAPERLIGEAVGLIVCVERTAEQKRRVTQIVRVEGFDRTVNDYSLTVIKD